MNLVAKPDQLVKRRGKLGLVAVNYTFREAQKWILDRMMKEIDIQGVKGTLTHFLIEPMMTHDQADELYICIQSHRYFDEVCAFFSLFRTECSDSLSCIARMSCRVAVGHWTDICPDSVEEAGHRLEVESPI